MAGTGQRKDPVYRPSVVVEVRYTGYRAGRYNSEGFAAEGARTSAGRIY